MFARSIQIALAIGAIMFSAPAHAKLTCQYSNGSHVVCSGASDGYRQAARRHAHKAERHIAARHTAPKEQTHRRAAKRAYDANGNTTYLAHPAGCPRIAFCACGAAVEIFGYAKRSLWLAANWFHFPRTSPASGMVAVRSHHVFVLREHIHGMIWMTADYNSGGHLSRLHAQSIAGYVIVNPHGGKVASRI